MAQVEMGPALKRYAEDFRAFAREVLGVELTEPQFQMIPSFEKGDEIVVRARIQRPV